MKTYILILFASSILFLNACRDEDAIELEQEQEKESEEEVEPDLETYPDWTAATHEKGDPNYNVVFNQSEVLRFDIEMSSSDWSAMQSNLSSIMGSGGRPGQSISLGDPDWFKCSVKFNGTEWYHVGVRYKGNSSLQSAYRSGNNKLSFKFDFDEFEDDYPALKNQRFYGFKQLNLNNNFDDASLMREKVGADLFRQFGLASANTTFCVVYLNNGSGSKYYGVYTLVEEVDDTVLDAQFTDGSGNLYKPDGDAASFAQGTYDTSEMELKTNEETADYADVKALYDAINSSTRTSDVSAWKSSLESVFDVDNFLKWLAANTVIQNWDTYGRMTHNYYIYNNPETSKLTWIPWDNNEAFQYGKQGGALSFSMSEVGTSWPLIKYLMAQDDYKQVYENYLQQFIDEVFVPENISATYATYYNLIKEYAYAEESGYTFISSDAAFDNAVESLKTHVQSRNDAVIDYLN
ncbi:CotH kinase family protein [Labilibacter marinus]|uniref:CotH kinase family protein n=1 Tax=Labilibacter marinus TaxID=1477105 RepID=UPI00094F9624|nr:CotH kinase family protein [Labilibacter marinus]